MVRRRRALLGLVTILLVGSGIYALSPSLPSIPKAHAANISISLVGITSAWNASTNPNPTITVHQGDTVTLRLSSGDGATHLFLLDADNDGLSTGDCPAVDPCSAPISTTPVTLTFTANFSPGTYTYYCTVHPTSMLGSFIVKGLPDYSLNAMPTSLTVTQGSSSTSTITVASMLGFTGTVNLSTRVSPIGPTANISPNSVAVPANGNVLATLTVTAGASTALGNYNVTVTATNGTTTRSVIVPATVAQAIRFNSLMTFSGVNGTIMGNFTTNSAVRQLTGTTSLRVINGTTGVLIFSKTVTFTMTYNTFGMGHFLEDIPTSPYWLSTNCAVNVSVGSVNCFLSRTPDITHGGAVTIVDIGIVSLQYGQKIGSPSYNPEADLLAGGMITIVEIGIVDLYYGATVILP
jgi:plastocyanin